MNPPRIQFLEPCSLLRSTELDRSAARGLATGTMSCVEPASTASCRRFLSLSLVFHKSAVFHKAAAAISATARPLPLHAVVRTRSPWAMSAGVRERSPALRRATRDSMSTRGGVRDRYETGMPSRNRFRVSSSNSPPQQDALAESFRDAMGELATGVVMVTCEVGGDPWGLTVSACCSVSLEPPLLLVSLGAGTASAQAITTDGAFGVSVLGESLIDVARFGSAKGQPKFVHGFCEDDSDDSALSRTPVVANAIAHVDCAVEQRVVVGDHVLFIGHVLNVVRHPGDRPLVYYSRGYHRLGESTDLGVGPTQDETIDSLLFDHPLPRTFSRDDIDSTRPAEHE